MTSVIRACARGNVVAIAIVLGVALLCSACAAPGSVGENTAGSESAATLADPLAQQPAKPSDPVAPPTVPPVIRNGLPGRQAISANTGGLSPLATVTYPDGVSLQINGIRTGTEQSDGPGQFPGRAYAVVDLSLENQSAQPIDLTQVVVTATYGTPARIASPVYGNSDAKDFSGTVNSGGTSSATYLFAVPVDQRGVVVLTVDFDANHVAATFTGAVR